MHYIASDIPSTPSIVVKPRSTGGSVLAAYNEAIAAKQAGIAPAPPSVIGKKAVIEALGALGSIKRVELGAMPAWLQIEQDWADDRKKRRRHKKKKRKRKMRAETAEGDAAAGDQRDRKRRRRDDDDDEDDDEVVEID
eukprot:CAMPEP_0185851330 /NCGR_PEP_ID=MMETSP1354-20130828/8964_1 /TAXON_ID=708628 /ORGANISM="Erythrolobus madagascarensis, Strain CCMP3276" /LENGTH=137 /DNA_ID=CAMNT_0028552297 /DNA_START=1 /DNA_END=414 /DNA_ORIENTATION=-